MGSDGKHPQNQDGGEGMSSLGGRGYPRGPIVERFDGSGMSTPRRKCRKCKKYFYEFRGCGDDKTLCSKCTQKKRLIKFQKEGHT